MMDSMIKENQARNNVCCRKPEIIGSLTPFAGYVFDNAKRRLIANYNAIQERCSGFCDRHDSHQILPGFPRDHVL